MGRTSKAFFLIIILTGSLGANAQPVHGVYLTEDDFKSNTLSYSASTDPGNYIVVERDKLELFRNGEKTTFKPGSVYGYFQDGVKYCGYRKSLFFNRFRYYKVIDESGLIVYALESSGHKVSGYTFYYYSLDLSSPIIRITKRAIRKSFAYYPEFVSQVNDRMDDQSVWVVDEHGRTILNKLYVQFIHTND